MFVDSGDEGNSKDDDGGQMEQGRSAGGSGKVRQKMRQYVSPYGSPCIHKCYPILSLLVMCPECRRHFS